MLTEFQELLLAQFQERGKNVNSASYCEVLLKPRDVIRRKLPCQQSRGVLLHHDNALPHTARETQDKIQELQRGLLEHSPYSPELAVSDFHVFGPLKNQVGGKRFADEEVETEVQTWLRQR
jgi:histone-lysine N-methyltransferase SETMAR